MPIQKIISLSHRTKLVLILLLGVFLRAFRIWELPLYGDELTLVYDTYSLLKTGMDQTGVSFPLTFSMGAGRPGGYIYFSTPFVALFGPGALGVRGLSLLSGIGIMVLLYLSAKVCFSKREALYVLLLAAVSPWDIYLSRAGFEAHFALFLSLLGVYAFMIGKTWRWGYVLWGISWGFSILTYPTYKLTLPVFLVVLVLLGSNARALFRKKMFVAGLVILGIFGIVALRELFVGGSEERFFRINVFANTGLSQKIVQTVELERGLSALAPTARPFVYNRGIEYSRVLFGGYMDNLSPEFLLVSGDRNPRHNPGELGMLYVAEVATLFAGAVYLWQKKRKLSHLLLVWIAIVPLATMLLGEVHGLRNSFMIPPLVLISGYGLSVMDKRARAFVLTLIALQGVWVMQRVYFLAPFKFASFWSKPARDTVELVEREKALHEMVFVSKRIDNVQFAYPVYQEIDPWRVIAQHEAATKKFENVYISDLENFEDLRDGREALVLVEKSEEFEMGILDRALSTVAGVLVYQVE